MTDQELADGKLAYETHRRLTGDDALPDWEFIKPQDKRAWALTAKTVIDSELWRRFATVFGTNAKNDMKVRLVPGDTNEA